MSANVIKSDGSYGLARLPIPVFGESAAQMPNNGAFVVPVFDPAFLPAVPQSLETYSAETDPEDIIENARREAAKIIADAEANKELLEKAAIAKGQAEARTSIDAEVEARITEVREQLAQSLERLANLTEEVLGHVESDLVELAMQMAKKIVRREVTIDREIALTLVRVSLSKLNQRTAAEVHLNPEDLAFINSRLDDIDFRGALMLVSDPSISLGGCLVHTETGDIDARIESQFDEIAFGLLT